MNRARQLLTKEQQESSLRRAQQAAAAGDPLAMTEALHQSYALDGLTRSIQSKWHAVPADEIRFIIAGAIEVLYRSVQGGEKILNVAGYLYKVADKKAHQYHAARERENRVAEELKGATTMLPFAHEDGVVEPDEVLGEELDWEDRRARACGLARTLLPKLGQKNIQDVMALIIDSVEAGREDLPSTEIADILGLPGPTVRKLRQRGFERLTQRAREVGITKRKFDFAVLDGQ